MLWYANNLGNNAGRFASNGGGTFSGNPSVKGGKPLRVQFGMNTGRCPGLGARTICLKS
jgi:hypothetical protein